ncbi:uncharacterized protein LOC120677770 [Panicum virgatum]|uniref:Uncharacterized protein n=1 Tax=Panicum virgatum TaxID=38727 RepID=A0A8T0QU79_PANVG|nr:uncharacterized protein LOC120677770 [Panicum virgatum]KAG2576721.1 hypothetical protein PVAP13_6NG057200 [Panicum virgatum]
MATLMMKKSRRSSSQGLLLLSLLLLASFSAIPALIRGESFVAGSGGRKSKMMAIGSGKAAVIHGDGDDDPFNGCTPHDARSSKFSCSKDDLWWPSLYECAINCPCMVNCN